MGLTLDFEKLGRYLAGEATPEEAAEIRRWLDANPSDAAFVAAVESASRQPAGKPVDVEAALHAVKTRARSNTRTPAKAGMRWSWVGYATAAAAVLAITLWNRRTDAPPVTVAAAPSVFTTSVGQRDSVTLADGSRVLLGPASRITVTGRSVQLQGEAYFRVVHDSAHPFEVRAGDAVIRDIGTEFSVHSDPAEPVRVVVKEGAVQLTHQQDSVLLSRGDVGVADAGSVHADRGAATPADLAWTRGELVFRNASMAELAADLRRWYGVELRVDSALLRRHFSGPAFVNEPPSQVVDAIALALGARAQRRGDTVFLRPARLR